METSTKKRGANYTEGEKTLLTEIIKKYGNIVECKKSDTISISKKRAIWMRIQNEFNSSSSVPREWKQLKVLWDNLKRRTKKSLADENKKRYLEKLHTAGFTSEDLEDAKKRATIDKREIMKTGGGRMTPELDEAAAQVLAVIANQIAPMENPFDDAAEYFGEDLETVEINSPETVYQPVPETVYQPDPEPASPEEIPSPIHNPPLQPEPQVKKILKRKIVAQEKKTQKNKKRITTEQMKYKYFKRKLFNANLQTKFMIKEHNIQMKIYSLQLKKLETPE